MSDDPSGNQESNTFKQHYAGTFVAKRQVKQHDPVDDTRKSTDATKEPDPLEVVMNWWNFIRDPGHSNAIMAIFTVVIALSSIGYGIVALCQWGAMRESNKINRESLIAVQRAFVVAGPTDKAAVKPVMEPSGKETRIIFQLKLENVGATSTKKLTYRLNNYSGPFAMTDKFKLDDEGPPATGILGPKSVLALKTETMPQELLDRTGMYPGQHHIYLWGWAKYRDIFNDTPMHLTEFCYEVMPYLESVPLPNKRQYAVTFNGCGRYTCADEECEDYSKKINEP
jgi:hypothetical protein